MSVEFPWAILWPEWVFTTQESPDPKYQGTKQASVCMGLLILMFGSQLSAGTLALLSLCTGHRQTCCRRAQSFPPLPQYFYHSIHVVFAGKLGIGLLLYYCHGCWSPIYSGCFSFLWQPMRSMIGRPPSSHRSEMLDWQTRVKGMLIGLALCLSQETVR